MVLQFYIDCYGDVRPHFEYVRVCNGDFEKSYLQDFLHVPGVFIDFVRCYNYEDHADYFLNVPVIVYDQGEMFYM